MISHSTIDILTDGMVLGALALLVLALMISALASMILSPERELPRDQLCSPGDPNHHTLGGFPLEIELPERLIIPIKGG